MGWNWARVVRRMTQGGQRETYRAEADVVPVRVCRVQVDVGVKRINGKADAAELEGYVDLFVARELPDVAGKIAARDQLRIGHVLVERLRDRSVRY